MNTTHLTALEIGSDTYASTCLNPPKFIRRAELSLSVRINIAIQAYEAQQNNNWGMVSGLSREYGISRTFIYDLLSRFKLASHRLFAPKKPSDIDPIAIVENRILAYRMEGKSSVEGISTLLAREGSAYCSVGYISQYLTKMGKSLPSTLRNHEPTTKILAFVYDEVYSKNRPILITVDPKSSAILSIELVDCRTSEKWVSHFKNIDANGFQPKFLDSDGGVALCAARAEMYPDIPWQLDTFHGIAHRLGEWSRRLEKLACKGIEAIYDCERILTSAKSDAVIEKRLTKLFNAEKSSVQAIELYEDFIYLYNYLIHQLNSFNANGDLRHRDDVKLNMEAALELMETLKHEKIKQEASSIKGNLADLLTYFDTAKEVLKNCQKLCSNSDALKALCLAWQWNKAVIKSKEKERRDKAIEQRDLHLELAALFVNDKEKFLELKSSIFDELDEIVQASSMVECINSILRPYLNSSKNQITQGFLNLFMFYHNHRRYRAGKRKGKTPMELLTGQEQKEDWIPLLRKEVLKKEPA